MAKNYITPEGFKKLQDEFKELFHNERPQLVKTVQWAASNGDRSENADYIYGKRRMRQIDARLQFLTKRIEAAQVIEPKELSSKTIVFGATVTVEDDEGEVKVLKIVGEDEYDPKKGKISWKSPMAKALMGKQLDDEFILKVPAGDANYTITKIEFK